MQSSQASIAINYALLIFIWATTPLAIVWSVTDVHYMWALVLRFWLALPIAVLLLYILKIKLPFHSKALHSYFAGSMSFIGSQVFTYISTNYLSSGMIALMFGLAPMIAGVLFVFVLLNILSFLSYQ